MSPTTLIKNATIVNEGRTFRGSLLIEGESIEKVIEGEAALEQVNADTVVEAEGCYLLPGVIDDHVHFRDPGLTHKADMSTESQAAAAGGVTTFFDMPNTLPQTTTVETWNEKMQLAARKSVGNYGGSFGATTDNLAELRQLDVRSVCGIKLFMGSSTGNMLVDDDAALDALFKEAELPIMVHCEDTAIINGNMKAYQGQYGADPDVRFHPAIRSAEACYASTEKAVRLARKHGAKLHVAHVTTARELELFHPADERITAEVCVPHLLFTDTDYARLGTRIKCNPAVKTIEDRDALRRALADGLISVVATDHAPHALSEKIGGAAKAVSGMPMVQFCLVAMLGLVDEGVLTIERLAELMSHAPARLFGVEKRGFIREGYKADIVLVRRHVPWTLTPNRILSRCNWSPLEGHTFNWRVEKTFCNGFLIYNNGHITDENYRGRAVNFVRSLHEPRS